MRGWGGIKREDHPAWKGGRRVDRDGYVHVYAPDHKWPRRGGYVREHILVMERRLDRRMLPGECVHHKNHVRSDNRFENLEIKMRGDHIREHRRLDAHKFKRDTQGRYTCGSI